MAYFLLKISGYIVLVGIILAIMPGIGILPLPVQFTSMLTSMFTLVKLIRQWPIIRVVVQGFNIYMWFIVVKISWNTGIFIISRFEDFRQLRKLSI